MRCCPFNEYLPQMGDVRTVVEVGAYRMDDTAWMRGLWQTARLVCFEPDPRNVEHIYRCQLSAECAAELYPYAVGAKAAVADFWLSTNLNLPSDVQTIKISWVSVHEEYFVGDPVTRWEQKPVIEITFKP